MDSYNETCTRLKREHHLDCVFNDEGGGIGNTLSVRFNDRGHLLGEFPCDAKHGGYAGMMHGGILAALADAGMAQCLMGHDIVAYTARMELRYLKPVPLGGTLTVRCRIVENMLDLVYRVRAEIGKGRERCVIAKGTFRRVDGKVGCHVEEEEHCHAL